MKVTVDRLEGEFIVLELPDKNTVSVPKSLIPDAKEGQVYSILRDESEEDERKERIGNLFDKLKK